MSKERKIILILLLSLMFLPLAATLIHLKIHSKIAWLPYLTLFDAFFVTALFYFKRTAVFALFLNSIFVLIGTGYHLKLLPGGWPDIMISLTDLLLGVAIYFLINQEKAEIKS